MASVSVIYLPNGEHGKKQGVDDFLASGNTLDDLMNLRTTELRDPPEGEGVRNEAASQSEALIGYAADADLFHDGDGKTFAVVRRDEHRETHSVKSEYFNKWLRQRFYDDYEKAPNAQALNDAISTIASRAEFKGDEAPVHIRVARQKDAVYVDLCNPDWEVVEITAKGYRVLSESPVHFIRKSGMQKLPHPVDRGTGKADALREFLNLENEDDWTLLASWIVQAMSGIGPFAILVLQGEQGSSKSSMTKFLKQVVDPARAPERALPKKEDDLFVAAVNCWVMSFGNISYIKPDMSDALCRISTGGGISKRELYTDSDEVILEAKRPVILNGITDVTTRNDLQDRAIFFHLPKMAGACGKKRVEESVLQENFDEALPTILGGFFDAVSCVIRELPNVSIDDLPRMADFAKVGTAAESALGFESGAVMSAYRKMILTSAERSVEGDIIAGAVYRFMKSQDKWSGKATDLLNELKKFVGEDERRSKGWPKEPRGLSTRLTRSAPALRRVGIEYEEERTGSERTKHLYWIDPSERHERHDRHEDSGYGDESLSGDARDANDTSDRTANYETRIIRSDDDLRCCSKEIEAEQTLGLDLETTGLDPRNDKIRLMSLSSRNKVWLIDCSEVDPEPLFGHIEKKRLLVHNALFDLQFLRQAGYVHRGELRDTMVMSRMSYAGEHEGGKNLTHDLVSCSLRELGRSLDKTHQTADWAGELSDEMVRYAAKDANILLHLHDRLDQRLRDAGSGKVMEIEGRAMISCVEMSYNGVPVDREGWLGEVEEASKGVEISRETLDASVGEPPEAIKQKNAKNDRVPDHRNEKWNWNSSEQVKTAAKSIGLHLEKTSKDYLSTLDHDFVKKLADYNSVKGYRSSYGESFFATKDNREVYAEGRLFPKWNMCQAATGRMSCSEPNVQNIPSRGRMKALRKYIKAPEGRVLVKADYSQIELRIAAALTGDERMLEAFRNGEDLHAVTARALTGKIQISKMERQLAKAVNFGLLFGQGAKGLREYARSSYGVGMTLEEAEEYREVFFSTYEYLRSWHEDEYQASRDGDNLARTFVGRIRTVRSFTEKVNHPVQGTGADGLKLAMALFHEECPSEFEARLILACHDELVAECPEERGSDVSKLLEDVMKRAMYEMLKYSKDENCVENMPIEVETEVSKSWGDVG